MKKRLFVLFLILCIFIFGCTLLISKESELERPYARDADVYVYCENVMINNYQLYDTLEIKVISEGENNNWRCLLEGFIKKFSYVDGILIIEFYDRWYTFDVENYDINNISYNLQEYETLEQLKTIYPNLESFEWKTGRYERTEENIIEFGWSESFKVTKSYSQHYKN